MPTTTVRTIAEVEADGEWCCCAHRPKCISVDQLKDWRMKGCPFLPGRKLRRKQVFVAVPNQRSPFWLWFYHGPTLKKIAATIKRGGYGRFGKRPYAKHNPWMAENAKKAWDECREFTDSQGTWVRSGDAVLIAGATASALWTWRKSPCPFLGGKRLRTKSKRPAHYNKKPVAYYLKSQLEELKAARESVEQPDGDVVTPRQAATMLGRTVGTVYWLRDHGKLKAIPDGALSLGKDGKLYPCIGFKRKQVEALQSKLAAEAKVPDGRITVAAAAELTGYSQGQILDWCHTVCPYIGRRLSRYKATVPTPHGPSENQGWLLDKKEIEVVAEVLRSDCAPPFTDTQGTWLSVKLAARRFGAEGGDIRSLAKAGKLTARRRERRDRWSRTKGGRRLEILEKSLCEHFGVPPPPVGGAVPPPPISEPTGTAAKNGNHVERDLGGRPEDDDVLARNLFCYERYITDGFSRARVFNLSNKRHPNNTMTELSQVRLNASRWANRFDPPLSMQRPQRRGDQNPSSYDR